MLELYLHRNIVNNPEEQLKPFLDQGPRGAMFSGNSCRGYLRAFGSPQLGKGIHRLLEVLLLCVRPDQLFWGGGPDNLCRLLSTSVLPRLLSASRHNSYILHG